MRIAMMTNNYRPVVGGVPVSIDRLSDGLRARGHRVTVFAPDHENAVFEPDVVRFRSHDANLPAGAVLPDIFDPAIEGNFRMGGFDVIHIHHPMLIGYNGLHLARKYGVPVTFTYHTQYEQFLHCAAPYAALEQRAAQNGVLNAACDGLKQMVAFHNKVVANSCDLVFAPTPEIRRVLIDKSIESPIELMPTGLAREDFTHNAARAADIRDRYRAGRDHLFCSVARLSPEKNIPFLLHAMARFKETEQSFRLLMIGDGPDRGKLQTMACDLGLGDDVVFTGCVPHDEMADYYNACDAFVFASKSETQGIVLLEAMAAGLPVVAVDACGVCDVVANNRNGYRTMESETQFAAALSAVVNDDALMAELRAGAALTASRYTADAMAQTAESAYRRMILASRQPEFAFSLRGRAHAAD